MIALRFCTVEWVPDGAQTRFPDGTEVTGCPHPELPHYHVIAHRCGYEDDLLRYCREHEACHSIVAEWFLNDRSPVLWGLAHGQPLTGHEAVFEELAAQALQRFIRANERPILGEVDWDALRAYALEMLGP